MTKHKNQLLASMIICVTSNTRDVNLRAWHQRICVWHQHICVWHQAVCVTSSYTR